jgi:hypothetical protein
VGTVLVRGGGRTLMQVSLLTDRALAAPLPGSSLGRFLGRPITLIVVVALLGGWAWALRRRRASRERRKRAGIGTA